MRKIYKPLWISSSFMTKVVQQLIKAMKIIDKQHKICCGREDNEKICRHLATSENTCKLYGEVGSRKYIFKYFSAISGLIFFKQKTTWSLRIRVSNYKYQQERYPNIFYIWQMGILSEFIWFLCRKLNRIILREKDYKFLKFQNW